VARAAVPKADAADKPTSRFASGEAREKLRKLIEATMRGDEANEAVRMAGVREREEMAAIAAAGGSVENWQPASAVSELAAAASPAASGRAQSSDVSPSASPPAAPAPPTPQPPAHYLKQAEPWREFVDENGIRAPYFRGYG
jgi:hypothetical protein